MKELILKMKKTLSILSAGLLFGALIIGAPSNSFADDVVPSPTDITSTHTDSNITLNWTAVPNTGDFDRIDYVITESPDGKSVTTTDTSYTFEDLSAVNHNFQIYARGVKSTAGIPSVYNFPYTGTVQKFTAPGTGTYTIEVWGAQGGQDPVGRTGGFGAYVSGDVTLQENTVLDVYVGQKGTAGRNPLGLHPVDGMVVDALALVKQQELLGAVERLMFVFRTVIIMEE